MTFSRSLDPTTEPRADGQLGPPVEARNFVAPDTAAMRSVMRVPDSPTASAFAPLVASL